MRCFLKHPAITTTILVIHPEDYRICEQAIGDLKEQLIIIEGGDTRQISTLCGLQALKNTRPQYVHIHDGARPFIEKQLLDKIHTTVNHEEGVLPVISVSDTLKRVNQEQRVIETISRKNLYNAQTPQCFPFERILAAHERAKKVCMEEFTDDSAIAEWFGIPMRTIPGSPNNIKITWQEDFKTAHCYLQKKTKIFPDIRTGNGYDVHPFEEGNHVTLCGIKIPFHKKLSGHSDADVSLHALTDALLATQGAGDIGTHFPPSDPQWKNALSETFLQHALNIVKQAGGRITNIDITLIAENPKIGPYHNKMVENLVNILKISPNRISIKATTNEKLGFIGREEGIAALATATVLYPGDIY